MVVAKAKVPAAANRKKSEKKSFEFVRYVTCYAMLLYAMMLCYILFYFFLIAPHPHQPHQKKEPMDLGLGMTRVREKIAQFLLQLLLASAAHYCSVEQNYCCSAGLVFCHNRSHRLMITPFRSVP